MKESRLEKEGFSFISAFNIRALQFYGCEHAIEYGSQLSGIVQGVMNPYNFLCHIFLLL